MGPEWHCLHSLDVHTYAATSNINIHLVHVNLRAINKPFYVLLCRAARRRVGVNLAAADWLPTGALTSVCFSLAKPTKSLGGGAHKYDLNTSFFSAVAARLQRRVCFISVFTPVRPGGQLEELRLSPPPSDPPEEPSPPGPAPAGSLLRRPSRLLIGRTSTARSRPSAH